MTKPLRVALIGFHYGHQMDYGRRLTEHADTQLVAVAASPGAQRDEGYQRGQDFARKYDVPHFDDAMEMIQTHKPDAVSIAVTPDLNADLVCACASAGIHILCEKPVTENADDMQRIAAAVRKAGVKFTFAAPAAVFSSSFRAARQRIWGGGIGEPRVAHFQFLQPRGPQYTLTKQQAKQRGRAEFATFGPYGLLAFMTLFRKPIRSVYAQMGAQFYEHYREAGVEDMAVLTLQLEGGGVGSMVVGRTTTQTLPSTDCRMQIIGSEGVINVEDGLGYGIDVYAPDRHYRHVYDRDASTMFVEDFVEAILQDRSPVVGLEEAIGVFNVTEAAYQSAKTRQPVLLAAS